MIDDSDELSDGRRTHRNAFWKVAVEGRPTADVAEELSTKPGTVRVSRRRILARLREEFGDLIETDK